MFIDGHGVTVHRGIIKSWQSMRRGTVTGCVPAECVEQRNRLFFQRRDARQDALAGLVFGQHVYESKKDYRTGGSAGLGAEVRRGCRGRRCWRRARDRWDHGATGSRVDEHVIADVRFARRYVCDHERRTTFVGNPQGAGDVARRTANQRLTIDQR